MGFLSKLFPSENDRNVGKLKKIADVIEGLQDEYRKLDDDALVAMTAKLRERLGAGETLDDILPEAYATVREASDRVLKMRHFYVQLLGGIALHQGRIAEMKTGEGKTLVATLPTYLNALAGKGMHVVTVNDYLARRDAEWMGKIFRFLGLTVGVVVPGMTHEAKKAAYQCDILYATNNELGFDYLRDNMAIKKEDKVQRELCFAIIDEVDSILIDEARTPLIISGRGSKSSDLYVTANRFAKSVDHEEDIIIEEKEKTVRLSEAGIERAEKFFHIENLADLDNSELNHHINNALKANFIMKSDSDYIVTDGEIIIVDEFTGRQMIGRRYSEGLHQAIEAKEGVAIRNENKTLATITFQNYFRLYKKLSGMTGTAKTEEVEFKGIYKLDVVVLPTNIPMQRNDENDQLFTTNKGKLNAVVKDIEECYGRGQPVLAGTVSVEKSEELSRLLKSKRIPHSVLNAKNHQQEAEIVAQAGKIKQVTIATNMAGRGTDIMLGGNPEYLAKQKMEKDGYKHEDIEAATSYAKINDPAIQSAKEEYRRHYDAFRAATSKEKEEVKLAGGLRIIGTERHESRRIDNQLRGRSGRQGDPGSSIFYISLDDDIARIFGGDRLKAMTAALNVEEDMPIANVVITKQIERAQKMVEDRNYSVRKRVLSYDDVMNRQRELMYRERDKVLTGQDIHEYVVEMIPNVAASICRAYADFNKDIATWDYEAFNFELERVLLPTGTALVTQDLAGQHDFDLLAKTVTDKAVETYEKKTAEINTATEETGLDFGEIERIVLLKYVDMKWTDHIDSMDVLRKGIGLRAYGQVDPVVAYQKEGFEMFNEMTYGIQTETVHVLMKGEFRVNIPKRAEAQKGEATFASDGSKPAKKAPVKKDREPGPNDPCPCGSGRKFKHCCGK
ncbi:MAG: preprotein translocase subunit SecA [Clostridiales bacterium]|jgi:preprotein translocase subunit SecA|nr:preprotein translocase subunit SecA [Clostridiales bacterium]